MSSLKRRLALAAMAGLVVLAGCASLVGPVTFSVPLTVLQQGVTPKFPVQKRVLAVLDLELSEPKLALVGGPGRIALGMNVALRAPFGADRWQGKLTVSGRLQAEPTRNALVLRELAVEQFEGDGIDPARRTQLAKLGTLITSQFLNQLEVYTFPADQLSKLGLRYTAGAVTTSANAVVLTLIPAP